MKSKYKPYPSYRDSGVEWLGDVPEHWKTSRLKFLCDITTGGKDTENKVDDGEYPFYVRSQTVERINSYSFNGEAILTAGDGVGVGKVFHYVNSKFDFHQRVYMFYAFKSVAGKFLFEYIKNNFYKVALAGVAKSTVDSLRLPLIQNFMITVPPLQEQQTIAHYLDSATAKIDTLIDKQTKLIALLKEKRQAVISTAVTRGLDNTVAMKDSGVEWLGEIPEGWDMKNVKYLLNNQVGIKIGPFGSALKLDDMTKEGYKVYGQENVINRNFNIGHKFISEEKFKSMVVYKTEPNDILITMMGTIGKCIVIPKEHHIGIIDSHLIKIRTNKLMIPEYFVMMIDQSHVVKTQLELNSKGSIMQGLNSSIIKSLLFPLPNVPEQKRILEYISDKTIKIDTLITKATKAIDLLKEKRTALISSAVTGKIDVREIA